MQITKGIRIDATFFKQFDEINQECEGMKIVKGEMNFRMVADLSNVEVIEDFKNARIFLKPKQGQAIEFSILGGSVQRGQ